MIEEGIRNFISDIHIEPYGNYVRIRFRKNGRLETYKLISAYKMESISSRIKVMASLDITDKRHSQDGKLNYVCDNKSYDIRVSTVNTVKGEKIVLRILLKNLIYNMEKIGLEKYQIQIIEKVIQSRSGLILVTGPTGSGKTTTLCSIIQTLNKESLNIITIEDPVENLIEGVCQIQVNEKIGVTFSNVLRSVLRQDPDVIMVGEIRDIETAKLALQASVTGHLVFATLHTKDSISTIARLQNMDIEAYLIAEGVSAIISQRLIECKNEYGEEDRRAIAEVMEIDENIRKFIINGKHSDVIRKYCRCKGVKLLDEVVGLEAI